MPRACALGRGAVDAGSQGCWLGPLGGVWGTFDLAEDLDVGETKETHLTRQRASDCHAESPDDRAAAALYGPIKMISPFENMIFRAHGADGQKFTVVWGGIDHYDATRHVGRAEPVECSDG